LKKLALLLTFAAATWAAGREKNVILFLGDGTGIPTLSAASILILFTAAHSYDLRVIGGRKGGDFLSAVRLNDSHTGEEVFVGAEGPGSERVRGMFPNTYLFDVMLSAYGWKK